MQNTNINFWGSKPVALHLTDAGLGIIDEDAVIVFTRGHCHSLALALHQETGWPIFGIGGSSDSPDHCVIYAPALDDYIDIQGPGVKRRRPRKFETNVCVLQPGEFESYLPAEVETAKPFAKTILIKLASFGARRRDERRVAVAFDPARVVRSRSHS